MLARRPPTQRLVQKAREQKTKLVEKAKSSRRRIAESYQRQVNRFKQYSQRKIDSLAHFHQTDLSKTARAVMKDYAATLKTLNKDQWIAKATKMAALTPLIRSKSKAPPAEPSPPPSSALSTTSTLPEFTNVPENQLSTDMGVSPAKTPRWRLPNRVFKQIQMEISQKLTSKWRTLQKLLPIAGSSVGNKVEIYNDGSQAFTEMWAAIRNAKKRVWLETYILKPDEVGLRTLQELTDAARRGVQVALIYDHLGSWNIGQRHLRELREANGIAIPFHNIWTSTLFTWRRHPLFRNHRKVLVVDDVIGFCGGMNVANDYAGTEVGGNGRYRDTHAKIEGPGVMHLAGVFLHSLKLASLGTEFAALADTWRLPTGLSQGLAQISSVTPKPHPNGAIVQVLRNDAHANNKIISKALTTTIKRAQERVYLTSPYFLPPKRLTTAIVNAAKRGVDVRILTSGKCETPIISQAAKHVYGVFLRNGVRVFELVPRELHAKTASIDTIFASVGSYNLDHLSSRHMLEANLNIMDSRMAMVVEQQFLKDLQSSREVSLDSWENRTSWQKLVSWAAYSLCTVAFAWT